MKQDKELTGIVQKLACCTVDRDVSKLYKLQGAGQYAPGHPLLTF